MMVVFIPCWKCNDSGRNSNACTCDQTRTHDTQYTIHTAKRIERKFIPYSDYATLAAAARKLVEAARWFDEAHDTEIAFIEQFDECNRITWHAVDRYQSALAEVEALLK